MENKNNTQQSGKTILQLMDFLSEQSNDSQLGDEFWADNQAVATDLATRLCITPLQAVLLSICLRQGPRNVDFDDIARHLDISNIRALEYSDELNALIRARYLKFHDAKDEDSFDIPQAVIRAFKNNEIPEQPKKTGLSLHELFDRLDDLFEDLDDNAIAPGEMYHELKELFEANQQVGFVRELKGLQIEHYDDWMVLVIVCHYLINKDDDRITFGQLADVFRHKSDFNEAKTALKEGNHYLMERGLIEHICEDGIANTSMIHLTAKARQILLSDFHLHSNEAPVAGLTKPESLLEKNLFYTDGNGVQVGELRSFLAPDRYKEIRERMKDSGYRSGFACLFYGDPGTGKTETVYQLARQTGRSILSVHVRDPKRGKRRSPGEAEACARYLNLFPGESVGKNAIVIRADGHGVPELLDAILTLMPLDTYVEHPVNLMEVVPGDPVETPIWKEYEEIVAKHDPRGKKAIGQIERFEFYREASENYCIIMTGEKALYANIMLQKGVVTE